MARVQTMEDVMAASIAPQRFTALLFASFAALALVLAVIGLYGVLAYGVARETREIGVRMALGASPGGMRMMVIRRSLTLAGVGALAGLLGAMAVTRTMEALLFEVRPNDPLVLVAVTAALLAVAALKGQDTGEAGDAGRSGCGVAVGVRLARQQAYKASATQDDLRSLKAAGWCLL